MHQPVLDLDLSGCAGRIYVAADIHGSFDLLDDALAKVGYRADADVVILIGDMIDRGRHSSRCREWIGVQGRYCLRGNHEYDIEGVCDGRISMADHVEDGGIWFHRLTGAEQSSYRSMFGGLPLAIRVLTPLRHRVGMVHADVAGSNFWEFCGHLRRGDYRSERIAVSGRSRIAAVRQGRAIPLISDVDHMFFGHTPVVEPLTVGNCSWIDTGLPYSSQVTLIDVDAWVGER